MSVMVATKAITPFLGPEDAMVGHSDWLSALRALGRESYGQNGLPSGRAEAWRFTSLAALAKQEFVPARANDNVDLAAIMAKAVPGLDHAYRVVLVDGRFSAAHSTLPRPASSLAEAWAAGQVAIWDLRAALESQSGFLATRLGAIAPLQGAPLVALNTAHLADGVVIAVPNFVALDRPIHVIHVLTQAQVMVHPRLYVELGQGAEATLVESHIGLQDGPAFANPVSEIRVAEGGKLHHYSLQSQTAATYHIASLHADLGNRASYDGFTLTLGAALSRCDVSATLGEQTECRLSGSYLLHERQHADTTSFIKHAKPGATSRQVFKGVLDGRSVGVFQGKIHVARGAQKTDGYQLSRALLLSDTAEVNHKPELEIFADDVKCSHGSTIGALDEDSLFYLRARGIPAARARALLIDAFVAEAISEVRDETVRRGLTQLASAKLGGEGWDNADEVVS
jgi:Fe-S cluster assembly protein SufD